MSALGKIFIHAYQTLHQEDKVFVLEGLFKEPGVESRFKDYLVRGLITSENHVDTIKAPFPGGEHRKAKDKLINDTTGSLRGKIKGHTIKVIQLPRRNFRTIVDGFRQDRLSMDFVEGELGLTVNRKRNGGNSETLARAIWRHFVHGFNSGDDSIVFESNYEL